MGQGLLGARARARDRGGARDRGWVRASRG